MIGGEGDAHARRIRPAGPWAAVRPAVAAGPSGGSVSSIAGSASRSALRARLGRVDEVGVADRSFDDVAASRSVSEPLGPGVTGVVPCRSLRRPSRGAVIASATCQRVATPWRQECPGSDAVGRRPTRRRERRVAAEVAAVERRDPAVEAVAHDRAATSATRRREPELLEDRAGRRRRPEVIEPDDRALVADPALPAERHADLDADALANGRRQDLVAVRLVLGLEPLPAGQRHDARRDAVLLERLGGGERELELRARCR